jgi:hypothetical protein
MQTDTVINGYMTPCSRVGERHNMVDFSRNGGSVSLLTLLLPCQNARRHYRSQHGRLHSLSSSALIVARESTVGITSHYALPLPLPYLYLYLYQVYANMKYQSKHTCFLITRLLHLGYMFRLSRVIIRPYKEQVQG